MRPRLLSPRHQRHQRQAARNRSPVHEAEACVKCLPGVALDTQKALAECPGRRLCAPGVA